jgi:hypothetical protein
MSVAFPMKPDRLVRSGGGAGPSGKFGGGGGGFTVVVGFGPTPSGPPSDGDA